MTARSQTALGAAMVRAGVNVAKTRLYQLALDMLRRNRSAADRGFSVFERAVEDDPDLVREALFFYYEQLQSDMAGGQTVSVNQNPRAALPSDGAGHHNRGSLGQAARPVREPSAQDRAAGARVAQAIAITVFDRVKTSDGRPWGNVGAHELDGMDRDGTVARIVKAKLGTLSNAQRFQTIRELLRPDLFEQALSEARGEHHGA